MSDKLVERHLTNPQASYDPLEAQKRSLMHKQQVLCNGEKTGSCCKHYWAITRIVPSLNSDFLQVGEKLRFCRAWGSEPLEFEDGREGLAPYCNIYEPDSRPYDADFEQYKPISPEVLDNLWGNEPPKPEPETPAVSIHDALSADTEENTND